MTHTLREWQTLQKPRDVLLYNCSEFTHMNDEWVTFPIGMGYTFINYHGPLATTQIGSHERLVLCAINDTTDRRRRPSGINRTSILYNLRANGISNTHLPTNQYFSELSSYKFVISPEGNGIDCHRHYEALMAGCIPIIEENAKISEKYGNCPILYTKDYSEITAAYLERKYTEMLDKVWDFSALFLSSYTPEKQEEIKTNGNYWSYRMTHKKWYHS